MKRYETRNCLLCNSSLNEPITWKLFLTNTFPKTICLECEQKFEFYNPSQQEEQDIISLYKYNDMMKDFIHRYKFMHDVILAKVFRQQIHEHLAKTKAIIVPIPIHPEKLKERTFAHVDQLLKEANIPFQHYLEKITTDTQVGKTRQQRINSPQLFRTTENVDIKGKEFLLVDDIYTTGTTILHAKTTLFKAGAKRVAAFTLIRG
ncbi:ComF family protein [Lysinibacillus telephonicus]|uniref:ComF family protein n=1 Tax=Lysinibacillus telephonicus TaxID=1714840 RepID=A0A3S0HNQ0_9BACI|nr:phosphoribosyltransferase family protein [Lysinibacillus telephonicus]RTQ94305.1 ComF family protein [Lysinibacillus telephonicus]